MALTTINPAETDRRLPDVVGQPVQVGHEGMMGAPVRRV